MKSASNNMGSVAASIRKNENFDPVYTNFMPMEAIIAAYQAINPNVDSLLDCLIIFNLPFTFIKGMISVVITLLVYKRLSPVIKGTQHIA